MKADDEEMKNLMEIVDSTDDVAETIKKSTASHASGSDSASLPSPLPVSTTPKNASNANVSGSEDSSTSPVSSVPMAKRDARKTSSASSIELSVLIPSAPKSPAQHKPGSNGLEKKLMNVPDSNTSPPAVDSRSAMSRLSVTKKSPRTERDSDSSESGEDDAVLPSPKPIQRTEPKKAVPRLTFNDSIMKQKSKSGTSSHSEHADGLDSDESASMIVTTGAEFSKHLPFDMPDGGAGLGAGTAMDDQEEEQKAFDTKKAMVAPKSIFDALRLGQGKKDLMSEVLEQVNISDFVVELIFYALYFSLFCAIVSVCVCVLRTHRRMAML